MCGTGFLKGADSSIISRPWTIFTTFLLSYRSIGVMDFYENIALNNIINQMKI